MNRSLSSLSSNNNPYSAMGNKGFGQTFMGGIKKVKVDL